MAVAKDLLGKVLIREVNGRHMWGRLVEVEAYMGPEDLASHSAGGRRSPRNEVMYGPPGHAYVYFTYGMHHCLNFVTRPVGVPQAVLVLIMVLLTGYSQFSIIPRMDTAEASVGGSVGIASLPESSPARVLFDKLHRDSVHVEGLVLILGFIAFAFAGRPHSLRD